MFSPSNNATQHKRIASARHPTMQMTGENKTASHSATRQQQSTSNLHIMARGPGLVQQSTNPKKMKLIRTRATGNSTTGVYEKKQRLKSPTSDMGFSLEPRSTKNKVAQGRQQSLNMNGNQFQKVHGPTIPSTSKHQRQQPVVDKFMFSATSPPVQINKQAIMMSANGLHPQHMQQQQTNKVANSKQKESLGHITASRRQKQSGLQINVDGGQSIVINSPTRGHVIASPTSNTGVPDNLLFYGTGQPNSTMSPAHHRQHTTASHLESLNHLSPKAHQHIQQRRQQPSSMSKKTLRHKVVSQNNRDQGKYDTLKQQQNQQIQEAQGYSQKPVKQSLQSYQITPKNGGQQFEKISMGSLAPRSTKARASQNFVKGRFIDISNVHRGKDLQSPQQHEHGFYSPNSHQQATLSTLDQQKQLQRGFSPRVEGTFENEPGQMLFVQSPPKHTSNRLMSPTNNPARPGISSSYNNRGANQQKVGVTKTSKNLNNSSLGFKTTTSGGRAVQSASNTLKIQNMRSYNETTSGIAAQTKNSVTTKHEQTQRFAMRNNFISPGAAADNSYEQVQRQGTGSNLRHFHNQSHSSAMNQSMSGPSSKSVTKKRKIPTGQKTGGQQQASIRPMSGAVRGTNRNNPSYALRTNISYVTPYSQHTQPHTVNQSQQRQSMSVARGKKMQILQTESENPHAQMPTRVYSPNATMNGRRDKNQELSNVTVPQFYPSTTTNSTAPRQIQFTQPSVTTSNQRQSVADQKIQNGSSACLIDEPDLTCEMNTSSNLTRNQTQDQVTYNDQMQSSTQAKIHETNAMINATEYSAEQSQTHQFISQQVVRKVQRRQSQQINDASDVQNALQRNENPQLTSYVQSVKSSDLLQNQNRNSRTSVIIEGGRDSDLLRQQHSSQNHQLTNAVSQSSGNAHELANIDATSALVIPNFSINLPQTTTAATAPKLSVDNMLLALDQNKNDINQKLQQRKIESARRPNDLLQPQQSVASQKPLNNLQVVVTHEMNPRAAGLTQAVSYKPQPQTTTNASKVPQLNFAQPQTQTSVQHKSHRQNNHAEPAPSQRQSQGGADQSGRRQNSQQPNTTVTAPSHRSHVNESLSQKNTLSSKQQTKQNSPKKKPESSVKSTTKFNQQLNQPSNRTSQNQLQRDSQSGTMYSQQIQFPMTPAKCVKLFGNKHLTEYEKTEILDFPQVYYFGEGVKKIQAQKPAVSQSQNYGGRESSKNRNSQQEDEDNNCGYDDSKGNYKVVMKDHIAYRYQMVEHLGRGSFGVAIKCYDHKTDEYVAIKIIKNKKKYYYQAGVELKILQYLKDNDPDDTMNIIHMKDYVIFRKHLCITFELMSINLYEFLKLNDFEGLSLSLVRRFAIQLLYSLKFLKENDVIHCDLKPENILLKDPSKSGIKIIDFGSSCFQDERVYTYIQSRFYRAPEIILGINYTPCIDMWSFGCIMAEFAMGYPIFPGEDETDQISLIMEVCGIPSADVLSKGQRKTKFFNENNMPKLVPNSHGKLRKPGTKVLDDILECSDQSFVNFVERCLEWDPEKRMTPDEAIRHQWILEGLPPKVLVHHQKLHNIPTKSLPDHIREARSEYLATQPLDVQMEFRDEDNEDCVSNASHLNKNGQKSKSVERTSAHQQHNKQQIGHPNVVKHNPRSKISSTQNNQQPAHRSHRQSQSYDGTSAYRHQNVSANVNAQQHQNLRHKRQVAVIKPSQAANDNKPSVEQMLHDSQRT